MKDFRGLEPAGFTCLGNFFGHYFVAEKDNLEYWHTGKLYRFEDKDVIIRFIRLLEEQNERDDADVAVGPAYKFYDERGYDLDLPTLDETLGHVGIYHLVGSAGDESAAKQEAYRVNGDAWDGVPQLASAAAIFGK